MILNQKYSWAVVGPGAIGLNYGARLAADGHEVHVLARSDAAALKSQGIVITEVNPKTGELYQEIGVRPASVATDASEIVGDDFVMVAAKSTVNEQLIESLQKIVVPDKTVIFSLQNGMGNAEFFAKHFSKNPILAGLCFVCVNRVAPGVVENYHPGRVEVGSLEDSWPDIAETATAAPKERRGEGESISVLDSALWRKLCWNIPFNGLSIAGGAITCDRIFGRCGPPI